MQEQNETEEKGCGPRESARKMVQQKNGKRNPRGGEHRTWKDRKGMKHSAERRRREGERA